MPPGRPEALQQVVFREGAQPERVGSSSLLIGLLRASTCCLLSQLQPSPPRRAGLNQVLPLQPPSDLPPSARSRAPRGSGTWSPWPSAAPQQRLPQTSALTCPPRAGPLRRHDVCSQASLLSRPCSSQAGTTREPSRTAPTPAPLPHTDSNHPQVSGRPTRGGGGLLGAEERGRNLPQASLEGDVGGAEVQGPGPGGAGETAQGPEPRPATGGLPGTHRPGRLRSRSQQRRQTVHWEKPDCWPSPGSSIASLWSLLSKSILQGQRGEPAENSVRSYGCFCPKGQRLAHLSFASRKALAKGLYLILRAVI